MRTRGKALLGAALCRLFPQRTALLRAEFTQPYWHGSISNSRADRLMRAHIARQASVDGTGRTLETLHREFWSAHADSGWYRATETRFEREFRSAIEGYLEQLQPLVHGLGIRTVCEIGTGNGYCLKLLSERLRGPLEYIGLDLSLSQIASNRARFPTLGFDCGDAVAWVRAHDTERTLYFTVGGVFEYLRRESVEELLRCIGNRPHPCLLLPLFEPVAAAHDLESDPRSHVYGAEFTFLHNYPALLREAGWRVLFRDDAPPVNWRSLSLCAASPACERYAQPLAQPAADHCMPTPPGTGTSIERVYASARAQPEAIAVSSSRGDLCYADLVARAERLAARLRQLGAGPGTRVGLAVERGPLQCVALLGTMLSGAAYVPLDPSYPAARLQAILRDCDPVLVIASPDVAPLFEGAAPLLLADDALERLPEPEPTTARDPAFHGPRPEDLCYIIYTSGSTGTPKGVALPHAALRNLLDWQCRAPGLETAARVLQFTPIGFDVHFQEFLGTWSAGGTLVLVDEETRRDPRALLSFIAEREIGRIFLPFVALQQLCAAAVATGSFPATLREVITAGEQLVVDAALRRFFEHLPGCRLHNHYGPSETHVVTSFTLTGPVDAWESLPPIGREIDGASILLLDGDGTPVSPGQQGELWIGGVCVADGYWNNETLSAERFMRLAGREGRWYRSGDLALRRPDGVLEFHGRADTQIKIRGHRVEPGEIEAAISTDAAVSACAVVARGDTAGERHLVAYLVLAATAAAPDADHLLDALRRRLAHALPDYLRPARYVVLATLPRTPSGKLDRAALPPPGRARPALRDAPVAPGTDTEERLARVWSRLLDVEPVGVEDNFFDLGGSSTMALELALETERCLGRAVPVVAIFRYPTIRQLAREFAGTPSRADTGTRLADRAGRQRAALSRRPANPRKLAR